jgi:hypothetical protein
MVRVDYIRVPGNTWIEDPDNRFTTVDMRGSMLEMVQRALPIQEETDGKPTQLDGKPTQLPDELKEKINQTGQNYRSAEDTITIILELCDWTDLSLNQLAAILNKNEKYLKNTYITPLRKTRQIGIYHS